MTQRQKDLLSHYVTLNNRLTEIAAQMATTAEAIEREDAVVAALRAREYARIDKCFFFPNRDAIHAFGMAGRAMSASKQRALAVLTGRTPTGEPS